MLFCDIDLAQARVGLDQTPPESMIIVELAVRHCCECNR